eukprot:Em0057g11a
MSSQIMLFTMYPSTAQLNICCDRLVKFHPACRDSIGSGYDSWKQKLVSKFKNLRRPSTSSRVGVCQSEKENNKTEMLHSDEYERHIKELKRQYSGKWVLSSLLSLMNVTEANRRHWIEIEIPPVTAVLEKFPCLVEPSVMVNEFQHITKVYHEDVLERWIGVQSKILAYGKTCGKTNVKKFLSELSAAKQSD